MPIRRIPYPNTGGPSRESPDDPKVNERVETGAVQFGDDWPGLFIRGDNASYFAMNINFITDWFEKLREEHPQLTTGMVVPMLVIKGMAQTINDDVIVRPGGEQPNAERFADIT